MNNIRIKAMLKKRILILISISLLVAGFLELWLFVPIPSNADNNSWLCFCGSIVGAIIGGVVTIWGLEVAIKSTYLNVKPLLRPVRTNFYVYVKDKGMTITDERLKIKLSEFYEKEDINFYELNMVMLIDACVRALGDEVIHDIGEIDYSKLYNDIKEICMYKSNNEAFKILSYELANKYDKKFNKEKIDKIIDELGKLYRDTCVKSIIYEENKIWQYIMPIYNIGAGNALDIEVKWDIGDNAYKEYCNKLGFNEDDYLEMEQSFSFDNLEELSMDIIKIQDGKDKGYFEIPCEIMGLVELIIAKSFVDKEDRINTNILLSENKIAQLKIKYYDIHGEEFHIDYDVLFKAWSNINQYYGYKEINFYFKFKDVDKKK